jgi:hypothetical protein
MHISQLGGVFCAAFVLTIALLPHLPIAIVGILLITGVALAALRIAPRSAACATLAVMIGVTLATAAWRNAQHVPSAATLDGYNGATIGVQGIVASVPEVRPSSIRFTLAADAVTIETSKRIPVTGNVQIDMRITGEAYAYGDTLRRIPRNHEHPKHHALSHDP